MHATCFDTLARFLSHLGSRRRAVAALSGVLVLLGLAHPEAAPTARSGKCKSACGECETCKKGKCKKKNGKKRCKKGRCEPTPSGTSCTAFAAGACQNGTCVDLNADEANCGSVGTACTANEVCQAGSCFPRSICPTSTTEQCTPGVIFCNTGGEACACSLSAEGNVVCILRAAASCPALTSCTTSANCPAGQACVEYGSCCAGTPARTCVERCPTPTAP